MQEKSLDVKIVNFYDSLLVMGKMKLNIWDLDMSWKELIGPYCSIIYDLLQQYIIWKSEKSGCGT